jgi:hypothetical protein
MGGTCRGNIRRCTCDACCRAAASWRKSTCAASRAVCSASRLASVSCSCGRQQRRQLEICASESLRWELLLIKGCHPSSSPARFVHVPGLLCQQLCRTCMLSRCQMVHYYQPPMAVCPWMTDRDGPVSVSGWSAPSAAHARAAQTPCWPPACMRWETVLTVNLHPHNRARRGACLCPDADLHCSPAAALASSGEIAQQPNDSAQVGKARGSGSQHSKHTCGCAGARPSRGRGRRGRP